MFERRAHTLPARYHQPASQWGLTCITKVGEHLQVDYTFDSSSLLISNFIICPSARFELQSYSIYFSFLVSEPVVEFMFY